MQVLEDKDLWFAVRDGLLAIIAGIERRYRGSIPFTTADARDFYKSFLKSHPEHHPKN